MQTVFLTENDGIIRDKNTVLLGLGLPDVPVSLVWFGSSSTGKFLNGILMNRFMLAGTGVTLVSVRAKGKQELLYLMDNCIQNFGETL